MHLCQVSSSALHLCKLSPNTCQMHNAHMQCSTHGLCQRVSLVLEEL